MRNLKKILSLALALVMVMSLLTVASAREFNDAADIEHTEAVEVMSSLGVINGKGNNTFDPKGNVTRGEMAKMITYISLGNVEASAFLGTEANLTDINGHWAEAFIKYCYSQGIISGRGNGIFDPNASVTAAEAARMLLVAIGYNADVQVYTGSQWKINVIRDAQISHFFDEVAITADKVLTRDEASQMMYNALTNDSVRKVASRSITTGEVIWEYYPDDDPLLWKSFEARVYIGTFDGNDKVDGGATVKGEIKVSNGRLEDAPDGASVSATASFPYDYDIANIGEEIKVIFKDGTTGTRYAPDKNDTIYGVYKTNATTVYNITKDDLQDSGANDTTPGSNAEKIKFGGSKYELADEVKVNVDFKNEVEYKNTSAGTSGKELSDLAKTVNGKTDSVSLSSGTANGWRKQSADTIKVVLNDEGKVSAIYVVTQNIGKVTSITSSRITISGVGAFDLEGNDVADGLAKDDVVVYTKLYDSENDEAYFTVRLAETVEGTLTGFKKETGYINVSVDGTSYEVHKNSENLSKIESITDDPLAEPADSNIGDTVRLFLMGGKVGAIQLVDENGGKYALITDRNNNGTIGSDLDPMKVVLLMNDGTKQTLSVHKDSTYTGTSKIKDYNGGNSTDIRNLLAPGTLIEYSSISGDSVKIKTVAKVNSFTVSNGKACGHGTVTMTVNENVWDKTSRTLVYSNGGTNRSAVAATSAVLYVNVNGTSDYYAYNLRDLGNIKGTGASLSVDTYTKDGQVVAAYISLAKKPGSGTSGTLHGIVTGYVGNVKDGDDNYQKFTVAVENGEIVEVLVDGDSLSDVSSYIAKGKYVEFDRSLDGQYDKTDFTDLSKAVTGTYAPAADAWFFGASRDYNASANLLRFYRGTMKDGTSYKGVSESSVTTTSDVKIIYVNADDDKAGDETGIGGFDTEKGYADILFHLNDDKIVDVIIVETSAKESLSKDNAGQNGQFGNAKSNIVDTPISGGSGEGGFNGLFSGSGSDVVTNAPVSSNDTLTIPGNSSYVANETVTTTGSGKLNVQGNTTLNDTATLGGSNGVAVATGKTLTLNGSNNTVNGEVALAGTGSKVVVNGNTTLSGGVTGTGGTIEVGEDATLTINNTAVADGIKITGAGKVVANAAINSADMVSVAEDLGVVAPAMGSSNELKVDLSNAPSFAKESTGTITKFSSSSIGAEVAKVAGATSGQFVQINVPAAKVAQNSYVRLVKVINGEEVAANGDLGVSYQVTAADGLTLVLLWCDNVDAFKLYVSNSVFTQGQAPAPGTTVLTFSK